MAAMTTVLTEFSDNGDSRTYTTSGHTISKPKLVLQKRRVPAGNQVVSETSISVIHGCEDSAGDILPQKVSFQAIVRSPLQAIAADVAAAKAIFLDIIAGDEFANAVLTQEYLS